MSHLSHNVPLSAMFLSCLLLNRDIVRNHQSTQRLRAMSHTHVPPRGSPGRASYPVYLQWLERNVPPMSRPDRLDGVTLPSRKEPIIVIGGPQTGEHAHQLHAPVAPALTTNQTGWPQRGTRGAKKKSQAFPAFPFRAVPFCAFCDSSRLLLPIPNSANRSAAKRHKTRKKEQ